MASADSKAERSLKPKRQSAPSSGPASSLDPSFARRVVVENVQPQIDCGRFPIKRSLGETVYVTADIHADGHDVLAAALLYRRAGDSDWREVAMDFVENDQWAAAFVVERLGRYEYTIE